jgi:hypothetical protein
MNFPRLPFPLIHTSNGVIKSKKNRNSKDKLTCRFFFFVKMYLQYVNTHTSVPDSTKIVPGQPISCRTHAVRGGHGATSSGDGRYSSEKMAQKKKHCSRRV